MQTGYDKTYKGCKLLNLVSTKILAQRLLLRFAKSKEINIAQRSTAVTPHQEGFSEQLFARKWKLLKKRGNCMIT